jgi:hypothetical protein
LISLKDLAFYGSFCRTWIDSLLTAGEVVLFPLMKTSPQLCMNKTILEIDMIWNVRRIFRCWLLKKRKERIERNEENKINMKGDKKKCKQYEESFSNQDPENQTISLPF